MIFDLDPVKQKVATREQITVHWMFRVILDC